MKKAIFFRDELLAQANISEDELQEWETARLVKADGQTGDKVSFYTKETLDRILHIKSLNEVGYQLGHIHKIIKKVGLPRTAKAKPKPERLNEYLTIGGLAKSVGISARAIKHWEDKGIIEPDMRSGGGFRLYSERYIHLCQLIKDLQLFGYSLEEIKSVSDLFRDFLALKNDIHAFSQDVTSQRLEAMANNIRELQQKMDLLQAGIERWEDLLKKKKKEISSLKNLNNKRQGEKSRKKNG